MWKESAPPMPPTASKPRGKCCARMPSGSPMASCWPSCPSFGIELDRPSLERLCDQALSAEEIAQPLLDQRTFHGRHEQMESDWIWICLSALWQRWFPDKPSFEALDDKMQAGYELRESGCRGGSAAYGWKRGAMCCASWIRAACSRFRSSTIGSREPNRCSTGFRIWKTSCGMRG